MKPKSILITGDISFANIESFRFGSDITNLFQQSDLLIGNLEALTTTASKKRKLHPYHLRANPKWTKLLDPFDAFSLANNHVLDYGKPGLKDTMNVLTSNGKSFFGAGLSKKEAEKPCIFRIDNIKIAVFGVSRFANNTFYRSCGTASDQSKSILKQISQFSKLGYFVIVMPHWSYEHVPYPSPLDRKVAVRLINAGADIIIGSHPHEMQGIENISGKAVFYSLGNFIFSSKDFGRKENWKLYRSFVVELLINTDHTYTYNILPYETSDEKVELLNEKASLEIKEYLASISTQFDLPEKKYKLLFYESIRTMRMGRSSNVSSVKKKTNWKKSLRSLMIKLKYMNVQDFKLAFYLYFTRKISKKPSND